MKVFLKPAHPDLKVRKPNPRSEADTHLGADGEEVELNGYWQRRINDGDVVKLARKPAAKSQKKGA